MCTQCSFFGAILQYDMMVIQSNLAGVLTDSVVWEGQIVTTTRGAEKTGRDH